MVIREINAGATPALTSNNTAPVHTDRNPRPENTERPGIRWSAAAQTGGRIELAQLHNVNERLNGLASAVRRDDRQLAAAGSLLGRMREQLYNVVKMFPPYPPGDADRIRFLRSFSGLRQQIDNLTIPPADARQVDLPGTTGEAGQAAATFAPAPQPTFDLPKLSETANDEEIRAAMAALDQALAELSSRQDRLAAGAERIQLFQGQRDKVSIIGQVAGGTWEIPVPGEQAAEQLSGDVRRAIAETTSTSIFGAQAQLAALAG